MRIVVVGLGKVGRALTAQLTAENNDIVAVWPATAAAMTCRRRRLRTAQTC